ncbi:MAG TPA: ATP-binding protein [Azonexus sp.]|nr:ATP-binding protein [Azonexus sp.]
MIRISFRQGMLSGFTVIVLLLGGAALNGWLVVERLLAQSRHSSEQAIALTASIQELGERTVDIERSARQYLVLGDPLLRQRFDENMAHSLAVIDRLDALSAEPVAPLLAGWRMVAEAVRSGLDQRINKTELGPLLARLVELNALIKKSGQRWVETQNSRILDDLEANRILLGGQIALALFGAVLAVLAMGWWLVRPVRQLEVAISRLGASRFDEVVKVGGPIDLRDLGKRLDWLRVRLGELESDRERALRHVSHELKTPLTALKEGVALLSDEVPGPLAANQREVVEILEHNVASLQQQIESLLSLNAAAFEARRLHVEPVRLPKLLESALQRHELHAQSRQLSIALSAPEIGVMLDAEKMMIVLDNLLSNAIDFSPEGTEIKLVATYEDKNLCLECIDQGPGVAPEDAQRIFDPFYQGNRRAPSPRRGSGVGLSIVRELVRAMGGTVALVPSEQGAHFCVELPDEK